MTKKKAPSNNDNLKDLPDFIYKGAVVEVRGAPQVIKDLQNKDGRLVLALANGQEAAFDPLTVREIPGSIPVFLQEGAILRVTDKNARRFGMPPVLDWEVSSFHVDADENGKLKLHVNLKHGRPSRWRLGPFNPRTMVPVPVEDPVTLKKDIVLKRPMQFKPK